MLSGISWTVFGVAVLLFIIPYYATVIILYFRKDVRNLGRRWLKRVAVVAMAMSAVTTTLKAQTADGNNGINQANTLIRSYYQTATQLMYAIGALVGLVGAIRVFVLWNSGHREEVNRAAAGWFGACVFLVLVTLIIQAFFGL